MTQTSDNGWGCDVQVSMPEPVSVSDVRLDMGSHAFTEDGLRLNLSRADVEQISTPVFAPVRMED